MDNGYSTLWLMCWCCKRDSQFLSKEAMPDRPIHEQNRDFARGVCVQQHNIFQADFLPLNVFTASKGSNHYILFAITAAGVVPCGGPKKSPRTSSIVQIIFLFRSFEISNDIQCSKNSRLETYF